MEPVLISLRLPAEIKKAVEALTGLNWPCPRGQNTASVNDTITQLIVDGLINWWAMIHLNLDVNSEAREGYQQLARFYLDNPTRERVEQSDFPVRALGDEDDWPGDKDGWVVPLSHAGGLIHQYGPEKCSRQDVFSGLAHIQECFDHSAKVQKTIKAAIETAHEMGYDTSGPLFNGSEFMKLENAPPKVTE
jgi:hypothetical protein